MLAVVEIRDGRARLPSVLGSFLIFFFFDDCSLVGRRLSPRDRAIIREMNDTVFLSISLGRALPSVEEVQIGGCSAVEEAKSRGSVLSRGPDVGELCRRVGCAHHA